MEPLKPFTKLSLNSSVSHHPKLYKKIDGEFFIDNQEIKFELRSLNIIDVEDIDFILVSNFNDLYAMPFITRLENSKFKGLIFMTVPVG